MSIGAISIGAIIGILLKEGLALIQTKFKNDQERKKLYFSNKIDVTIKSYHQLSIIENQLHNLFKTIDKLKDAFDKNKNEVFKNYLNEFSRQFKNIHENSKNYPYDIELFYGIPRFKEIYEPISSFVEEAYKYDGNLNAEQSQEFIIFLTNQRKNIDDIYQNVSYQLKEIKSKFNENE